MDSSCSSGGSARPTPSASPGAVEERQVAGPVRGDGGAERGGVAREPGAEQLAAGEHGGWRGRCGTNVQLTRPAPPLESRRAGQHHPRQAARAAASPRPSPLPPAPWTGRARRRRAHPGVPRGLLLARRVARPADAGVEEDAAWSSPGGQVYGCCGGALRLDPSGVIGVPLGAVDYYCGGACVMETEDVLNCVASALDGFSFRNGASVEGARYALRTGARTPVSREVAMHELASLLRRPPRELRRPPAVPQLRRPARRAGPVPCAPASVGGDGECEHVGGPAEKRGREREEAGIPSCLPGGLGFAWARRPYFSSNPAKTGLLGDEWRNFTRGR
ncbi:uncharacterized protein [Triticum aestivum]|uniref:uncharacterized protein n=1 Tax=Triticum aestivum TaxID=4565 RepID=UPI001D033010|nr:uncharacterized protein LOC123170621 [Triticum aestivum]